MTEIEIGRGKRGRRAYAFDDIAVVPDRRTRDPKEVSIAWQIDAYRFELPFLAAPMDSVVSPATAIASASSAASACSTSKGLWTRYEDPAAAARRDRRAGRRRRDPPAAGDLRRADQGGADRAADQGGRAAGVSPRRRALPAAHRAVLQGRRGRRRGHLRHPRHHGLRRARLGPGRAAEPEAVHLRARRAGHRRRLRHVHGRAAPDAHRRGRRAGRLRRRRRAHHPQRARASRCRWRPRSPTWPRPAATTWTSPAAGTCTSSRTAAWAGRGDLAKAIACGADAVMMGSPLARADRRAGPRPPLGHGGGPRGAAARQAGRPRHGRHDRGDPARARRTPPTAR